MGNSAAGELDDFGCVLAEALVGRVVLALGRGVADGRLSLAVEPEELAVVRGGVEVEVGGR